MPLSPNAETVLGKRYYHKDENGQVVENAAALFSRVSNALAAAELPENRESVAAAFTEIMYRAPLIKDGAWLVDFLPNSPTLSNAGTEMCQSACFVIPVEDNLPAIMDAAKWQALIQQAGGGTGFSFSNLRPKDDVVKSTQGVASGQVSFMHMFNAVTEVIKQGSRRRGANMAVVRADSPEIMAFIACKDDLTKMTNFNISVAATNAFMEAWEAGTSYDIINPRTGLAVAQMDAREVMQAIVDHAHETGEPGLVFIDRMNEYCPIPWMGKYDATNPCGEQPLLPWESCNLGSINLENFVINVQMPDGTYQPMIDWARMRGVVHTATRLLNNVVATNHFPIEMLKTMSDATVKIGIGVMGFARMLFKMGVRYGSDESCRLAGEVMSFIDYESKVASIELSKERGAFPARKGHEDEFNAFFGRVMAERHVAKNKHPEANYLSLVPLQAEFGIRNSNTGTVAPTGTLSIIADTSGGCEPVFGLAFKRFQAGEHMVDADPLFAAAVADICDGDQVQIDMVLNGVEKHEGSLRLFLAAYDTEKTDGLSLYTYMELHALADVFVAAHDITPAEHVRIQAAFQAFNDSAISKTINFPENATKDDVAEAYRLAWETGCKGITVYRNNCRQFQPLSVASSAEAPATEVTSVVAAAGAPDGQECPECKAPTLNMAEGCESCPCGYSACHMG